MSELIILAVFAILVILALAAALAVALIEMRRQAEQFRHERDQLLLAVQSRNATEFAMGSAKIAGGTETRPDRANSEPPVGL